VALTKKIVIFIAICIELKEYNGNTKKKKKTITKGTKTKNAKTKFVQLVVLLKLFP
jgi:hypothetical protein